MNNEEDDLHPHSPYPIGQQQMRVEEHHMVYKEVEWCVM